MKSIVSFLLDVDGNTMILTPISHIRIGHICHTNKIRKDDGFHLFQVETEYDRGWNACVDEFLKIIQENEA